MTVLAPKKPLETREPLLTIDELPAGAHVLRLVVVDDEGNSSDPFDVTIEVTERGVIVPPIDPRQPRVLDPRPDIVDPVVRPVAIATPLATPAKPATTKKTTKVRTTKPPRIPPVKPIDNQGDEQ